MDRFYLFYFVYSFFQTYFNGDVLTLIRNLVTGSVSSELDELLAEGKQPTGLYETQEIAATRNRCRVAQISLVDGPLSDFGVFIYFWGIFVACDFVIHRVH